MSAGWIKLHRQLLDHEHYRDSAHLHVWLHLLLKATHAPLERTFNGRRVTIQPGQVIIGRNAISRDTGVNPSKVKRVLQRLKADQQIDQQAGNRSSLLTIRNWSLYQSTDQQDGQQTATPRPAVDQQATTHKKERTEDMIDTPAPAAVGAGREIPSLQAVKGHAAVVGMSDADAEQFFDYYEARGWRTSTGQPVHNWQAMLRRWKVTGQERKAMTKAAGHGDRKPVVANYGDPNDPLTGQKGNTPCKTQPPSAT